MAAPQTKHIPAPNFDALKKVYLFSSLTSQELNYLAGVVKRREFGQGSVVFREGDEAVSLFVVETGTLRVVKSNLLGGEPIVLTTLLAGTLFGEVPFVAGGTRTANIMCLDTATAYEVAYDELERLASLNPTFGLKLYKQLAAYLGKSLRATTVEMAGPKPEVKTATRTRTGKTGLTEKPGPTSGEIIIKTGDED